MKVLLVTLGDAKRPPARIAQDSGETDIGWERVARSPGFTVARKKHPPHGGLAALQIEVHSPRLRGDPARRDPSVHGCRAAPLSEAVVPR